MKVSIGQNNFLVIVTILAGQFGSFLGHSLENHEKTDQGNGKIFDFIVVGGGTAGCGVASRLAQSGEYTVLLIEAGGIPPPALDIPATLPVSQGNLNVARIYPSVRHQYAALELNGTVNFMRGNVLGGGSSINGQILNRGSPHDYNNWAMLTRDDSWNYANMLKYFRKYENYSGDYPSPQRGFGGPITISRERYAPGVEEWLQAGRGLGYKVAEPNDPQIISFTRIDFTHKWGRRVSSYKGYIEPMLMKQSDSFKPKRESNLHILINTEVNKIIFEGDRAVGVRFRSTNSTNMIGYARARKEIIVSAGAVESPILLMKSGIGPKSVLEGAHIPIVKVLPVGKNLHDHPLSILAVAFSNNSATAAFDEESELTPEAWRIFEEFGDGPYASSLGQASQAFLASSALPHDERYMDWADLQLVPLFSNVRTGIFNKDRVRGLREGEIAVPWGVWVGRPRSRGTVTLNREDIEGIPLIDFQYLTNPYDIRVMVDGIKALVKICEETEAFQKIGCRIPEDRVPACGRYKYRSNSYWECHARQRTYFGFHAGGSCKMGRGSEDHEAVVDSKLRVIGIQGLRVVDASIMPSLTNANIQTAVYAIAEKAAEMILQKWRGWRSTPSNEHYYNQYDHDGDNEDWSRSEMSSWPLQSYHSQNPFSQTVG